MNGDLKLSSRTVDKGNWVNKDVENQAKSLCPFIRSEVDIETKINPRPLEEITDFGQIDKYKKKNQV